MKTLILVFISFLSYNSIFAQDFEQDKKTLRYLKEVEWPKAYREQDTLLLDRILADEFQVIEASGEVSNKKLEIAYIKKNKPTYDSFQYIIQRLEVFKNGVAVISGMGKVKGKNEKGEYETTYLSSNHLIKQKNQWKAISSHVSNVKTIYK